MDRPDTANQSGVTLARPRHSSWRAESRARSWLRLLCTLAFVAAVMLAPSPRWMVAAQPQTSPPAGKAAGGTKGQVPTPPASGQTAASPSGQTPAGQPPAAQTPTGQAPTGQAPTGQTDPQGAPTFRTGINFVRVDAFVTDKKGDMVLDLKAGDFDILEDSKAQKIESFKLVKVTGQPENGETPREIRSSYVLETEAARDDVRLFVIYLDDYHVRRGASMVVREPLIRFIRNQLGPLDLVGVMYPLMPFDAIDFTRNRDATIAAIEHFDGRKYDYKPMNEFEEKYAYYPVETVEQIRNQVSLSALRSLVGGLSTMREGRKSVVLVSEGYTNYVPPQMRDQSAQYPGSGNPNRNNPFAGENNSNEDRARFFQSVDILGDLREVFQYANRANTSIYSLDPRGLAVFEHDINEGVGPGVDAASLKETQDTLRILADETDGRAIVNRNDLDGGLKQMVKDSTAYYLIGYNSSQAPADGKFHEIKVKVKRQGLQVRARKGYWALTHDEMTRATAPASSKPTADPALTKALEAVEAPARAKTIRTWIGTSRAENGKTNVTFVWEPVPPSPGATAIERREPAARVTLVASAASGGMVRKRVPDPAGDASSAGAAASPAAGVVVIGTNGTSAGSGAAPAATNGSSATNGASASAGAGTPPAKPVGGRTTFAVPPGQMSLKLSVEAAGGQVLDSDFRDMIVPDYTRAEPALSEPAIYRARTQRDMQAVLIDPNAMPTATREFSRTERLVLRFNAYLPGASSTTPTVELLNRDGKKISDVPAKPFAAAGTGAFQAELPLAAFPAGDFLIAVKLGGTAAQAAAQAQTTAAGAEVKRLIAFRISG
jgi:VWFA-related protein